MITIAQTNIGDQATEALGSAFAFIPKLIGFLVILAIGYFVAKAVSRILARVLERVGFDRAVERGGVKKALEKSQYDPSDIIGKLAFYALLLFTLVLAFGVFPDNPISQLLTSVVAFLPRVIVAIVIVVVAAAIAAAVREIIDASLGGLSYGKALATAASTAILAIGLFAALDQLQIAPNIVNGLFYAALAIVVGVAVVAIGGGGIAPMRQQWERALNAAQAEAPRLAQEAQGSKEKIKERAEERKEQAQQAKAEMDSGSGQPRSTTPIPPGSGASASTSTPRPRSS